MEVGNTPPSSLPLGLPPPIDIFGEVAVEEVSSEYEDISSSFSSHTPMARASFLKDKAVSLLSGGTVQTYFGPFYTSTTQEREEDLDHIVHVGTPGGVSVSGSADFLLPHFKSGLQVEFKRYELSFGRDKSPRDDEEGAEEDDSNDCSGDTDVEVSSELVTVSYCNYPIDTLMHILLFASS